MEKGWKEVYMTASGVKAEMSKDILENAGIKCVIMNQHDSAYQSFGEYLILTSEKDVVISFELLKNLKGE